MSVQDFAREMRQEYDDSSGVLSSRTDRAQDLAYEAHAVLDILPDDRTYQCLVAALDEIASTGRDVDPLDAASDWADAYVDAYTEDLLAWLALPGRSRFAAECAEDLGMTGRTFAAAEQHARLGQYREAEQIFHVVWEWLEQCL